MIEDLIGQYVRSYNGRDIEGMLDCVTEDVVFENISNHGQTMKFEGRDKMREVAELSGRAFSYRRQKLISLTIGDGRAAAVPLRDRAGGGVRQLHDLPTVHVAEQVGLRGMGHHRQGDPGEGRGPRVEGGHRHAR